MNFRYLNISKTPSDELLELLNTNIIGTPGQSMLYQHMNVNEKLLKIDNPYFVNLERAGRIMGTCCFCKRVTSYKKNNLTAFYVRYFSFKDVFRKKSEVVKSNNRISELRREVNALLQGEELEMNPGEKFFHYAYVDVRNKHSAVLCEEFRFEPVRQYTTIIFSRLFPAKSTRAKIVEVDAESAKPLLKDFYQEFNMVSFENLADKKYYFIENEQGERVAGVQVNPDQWKIHSLSGVFVNSLASSFSSVPILNRVLNKEFHFLTFENFYWMPGCGKYLEPLFEHLLARYGVFSAICVVDADSKIYHALKLLRLGLVNKLNKEVKGDVICRFENFTAAEKSDFKSKPAFLSGIDAT